MTELVVVVAGAVLGLGWWLVERRYFSSESLGKLALPSVEATGALTLGAS